MLQNNIFRQAVDEREKFKKDGYTECEIKKVHDKDGDGFKITCNKPNNSRNTRSAKFFTDGSYKPAVFEKMRGLEGYRC